MATKSENAILALNYVLSVRKKKKEYYSLPERAHIFTITSKVQVSAAKS